MQFSYNFLQHSSSNQFKDMAFFQMLKRKGPYIERSLTKIENDLFYRHKLQGSKTKNMTFIKQIRLTLSAYEILVNEIRNDFSMTELDSLGDSIHKLFSQMISIINFFVAVALKKQKLTLDELRQMSMEEVKQKEVNVKKQDQEQIAKVLQQAERQKNDMFKQIQRLKFNFNSLFKMQIDSDKQKNDMEKAWLSIVETTIQNAKESILIKDSELEKIIKDSCEYLYKNHSELDRIVKLTKQDITLAQKSIETFGDQKNLLEQNNSRIQQMKLMAKKLVNFVRDKVYGRAQAMVQTDLTLDDGLRVMMTTKDLDEKRRNQAKIKAYERQMKEKDQQINQIDIKLKQTEQKLKKALQPQSPQQSEEKYAHIEPIRQQPKKRSFPSNNNQQISSKFSSLPRNNRNKNVKAEQLTKQKTKQFNSISIPTKVPIAGNANSQQGSLNYSSASLNQSNNKVKKAQDKKGAQLLSHVIEKGKMKNYVASQHQMMDQKTSNHMSQTTLNDGTVKRSYKERQSAQSQENKRATIDLISIGSQKQREQQSEKEKNEAVIEKKSQTQEDHEQIQIPRVNKRFYKARKSLMILQAKSFQQMSRAYIRSRENTIEQQSEINDNQPSESQQNLKSRLSEKNKQQKPQISCDNVSIDQIGANQFDIQQINHYEHKLLKTQSASDSIQRSSKLLQSLKKSQRQLAKSRTLNFTINQTMKLTIRPFFIKRYLQSTYNHPVTQQKLRQNRNKLSQSNDNETINKIEKIKKSNSQSDFNKLCFETLDIGPKVERGLPNRREPKTKLLWSNQSKMVKSSQAGNLIHEESLNFSRSKQQVQLHQNQDISITPEHNTICILKLKNQSKQRFHSLGKDQDMVLNNRIRSPIQFSHSGRKLGQNNLRKSTMTRQNSTFYMQSRNRDGIRTSQFKR